MCEIFLVERSKVRVIVVIIVVSLWADGRAISRHWIDPCF